MKKTITTLSLIGLVALSGLSPIKAFADCTQNYGGGQTCTPSNSFSIEKMVQVPGKGGGNYVDNLSINDAKYSAANTVSFKLVVKNTGSTDISSLTVTDRFPQFLSFVSGPGSFDSNSKVLTFTINNFKAGDTQNFFVTGKVSEANLLPADQGVVCLINQSSATDNNGATNNSNSQFCVQKTVLGTTQPQVFTATTVTSTPATGPEMLPLLALIPGGLSGLILRKKAVIK